MKEFIGALLHFDIDSLFRKKTTNTFIQFFRYIFVGGFAFLVDAFVLWLCEKFVHYMIAAAIAFVVGLAANYLLSIFFVFSESKQVKNKAAEFTAYAVIGVIGLGLTEVIMYLLTDICGLYFLLSKIIAAAIVLVWNFVARKKILYTNKQKEDN
ncbi:MAG: GtrA family protein [Oscillospiraceae bacterium]|nr:GtrA family protein [Oscillospiraceae bacterium]